MSVDWAGLFEMHVSAAELVVRGSLMYWFLFLVFRFVLKRDVGAVGIADILLLVLIADASQNAMAGGYDTVAEGFVLVGTLIGWNYLFDWAAFRWKAVRRFVEPPPLLLVRRGRLLHRNLRAEHLTLNELKAHLRANGLVSWHAKISKIAYPGSRGPIRYVERLTPFPAAFVEGGFTLAQREVDLCDFYVPWTSMSEIQPISVPQPTDNRGTLLLFRPDCMATRRT